MRVLGLVAVMAAAALASCSNPQPAATAPPQYKLERVVMLMRHSVRPPTSANVTPPGLAAQPWSTWTTAYGELTPHGAAGAKLMGVYDRGYFAGRGLVAASGCPAAGEIAVWASGKSRAIETAKNYVAGMYPDCTVPVASPPDENNDPVFHPLDMGAGGVDGARAKIATDARLPEGGIAALQASMGADFAVLQRVLGCCAPPVCVKEKLKADCKLADFKSEIVANKNDSSDMSGILGVASTAGQSIALEYLEGKPMEQVGWGRASKDDIVAMLRFHPVKFYYETRTPYVSERIAAPIARRILGALNGEADTGKLTLLVGHDTNIASLGGMLDLHWTIAEYPTDDPPPGGALGFELVSDAQGGKFVRAFYQAQTMDQLRNLTPLTAEAPPALVYIPITGCTTSAEAVCPLAKFQELVQAKLDHPAT